MKKILTFICAVVVALTANASTMKKMAAEALQPQHRELNAPVKNHDHARRLAMENYPYTIEDYAEEYYANPGVLQIDMTTSDGYYTFHFAFDGINALEANKTYTLADCYADPTYGVSYYTYADDNYYGDYIDFESFTLIYTIDATTGLKKVVANVVDLNSDTYELTYNEPAKPESFVDVPLTMDQVKFYDMVASNGFFQVMGMNADGYYASLVVSSNSVVGSYTTSDILYLNQDYSVLYYGENMIRLCDAELEVTAGDKAGDYNMTANLYGYDGNKYIITMNYIVPVVTETIQVNCTNLNVDVMEFWGMVFGEMTASNADYSLFLELDAKTGTFEDQLVLVHVADNDTIDLFSSSITIASATSASGEALGMDGKYYVFTLSFEIPDPTETISFTAPAGEYKYYEDYGDYYITAYSSDQTYGIALDIITDNLVGTFDLDDLDASYTGVYQFDAEGNTVEKWSLLSCSATITLNPDGTYKCVMTGQGLGTADKTSSPSFSITIDNIALAEYHPDYDEENASCTTEVFDEYAIDNSYLSQGMVIVDAFNDNVTTSIAFVVNPAAGLVPGTYTIADTEEEGTVMMGSFEGSSIYPSYIATLGQGGLATPLWYFISGTVTVEEDMDIVVDALNSYNQPIQFTLPHTTTGLDRLHINGNVMKYFHNNHLIIRANDKQYMISGWAF